MQTSYTTVMEFSSIAWTVVAYVIHGTVMGMQVVVALLLVLLGAHNIFRPHADLPWLRRLGATRMGTPTARRDGAIKVALGSLLLLPLLAGAPVVVSVAAAVAAIAYLWLFARDTEAQRSRGVITRGAMLLSLACTAGFGVWEREDGLALGTELFTGLQAWRVDELNRQLQQDLAAPKVGELAPDFELMDATGTKQVRLSQFRGQRPVALIFGSSTCPPFTSGTRRIGELHRRYGDAVEFVVVYVKEAHPSDKWWLGRSRTQASLHTSAGYPARLDVRDPTTLAERRGVASTCGATLLEGVPLYVDAMDDGVSKLYAAKPTRIYLLNAEGRVVYNPGLGPFGYNPDHLEREIKALLES